MKQKPLILLLVAIIAVGGLAYFYIQQRSQYPENQTGTVKVAASFYPLAEFARQAGGDLVTVSTVVPADSEPHEYEPTPQELTQVYSADVFIYNGAGVDPWAEQIAPELIQKGVQVIDMSEVVSLIPATEEDDHGEEEGHDHDEEHESQFDPHFWLDPILAQAQVASISDKLAKVDPEHAATYKQQGEAYQSALQQLDHDFRQGLAACTGRDIVTSHAAFGYLAQRYNLSVINIAGISPEEEPSAKRLSEIADLASEKNIRYIFFETLVSPKLAQTIASEIGAQTLVFNPLEGLTEQEQQAGDTYLSVMEDNLMQLRTALECQ